MLCSSTLEPVECEEASATSAPPQHRRTGASNSQAYTHIVLCTIPPFKTLLAHPWGLGSLWGRRLLTERRRVLHRQLV
jgi:hypothetical protein